MPEKKKRRPAAPFVYDKTEPIQKAKTESWRANSALRDYYQMGPARSLRKLLDRYVKQAANKAQTKSAEIQEPPTTKWTTMGTWSKRHSWVERVSKQDEIDREDENRLWLERRRAIRERDFDQGDKLRELADKILEETPNFIKTTRRKGPDGGEVIFVALDGHLMVKALEKGSDLQRMAAEIATENIDVRSDGKPIGNISELRDKLMDRISKELEAADADPEKGIDP